MGVAHLLMVKTRGAAENEMRIGFGPRSRGGVYRTRTQQKLVCQNTDDHHYLYLSISKHVSSFSKSLNMLKLLKKKKKKKKSNIL